MKKWFDLRRWLIMKIEIDDEIKLRNIIKDAVRDVLLFS